MKFFTFIFSLLLSTQALAHHDHLFSDNQMHTLYHAIFWGLCALVAVKGVAYFKAKKKQKAND